MKQNTYLILLAGGSLAVLGDLLLRAPPGLNLVILVAALIFWTARATSISPLHSGLAVPTIFFAACVAWRDAAVLSTANTLAVLGLLTFPCLQHSGVVLRVARISDYVRGLMLAIASVVTGSATFLTRHLPDTLAGTTVSRLTRPTLIGVALSVPIGLVFLILFSSADPAFARATQAVYLADPGTIASHVFLGGAVGLATIGYLFGLTQPTQASEQTIATSLTGRLGIVEVGIPLATLIGICTVFIGFQLPYLFGGLDIVQHTPGLSYASYARRGFFELTIACGLVIPILLVSEWLLRPDARVRRIFHRLAIIQVGLVLVLMTSAHQRMALYWQGFGFTTARFYATVLIGWMGIILVYFVMTVLRGHRNRFAFGTIVSGLLILAGLNFSNPDSLVMRLNLARGHDRLDSAYALRLSADAAPSIVNTLLQIPEPDRCRLALVLAARWSGAELDWRSWNLSRRRARGLIKPMVVEIADRCEDSLKPERPAI